MNAFKKISAIVLSLAMIMSCAFSTVVFADNPFTDVDSTNQFATAIEDLVDKGIINGYANEDGTYSFKPEGEITRAEFAKIIAVASVPTGYVFGAYAPSFSDVLAGNWALPYIEYAVRAKIINGMGDGTFAPDSPVTYAQAVKMVVCALGYGNVITPAAEGTPWYQPYIEMANRLNVTTGAFSAVDANASRGLVAQLIYNMNKTSPVVQTGVDSMGKPIYSSSGSSYESETKNTKSVSGQLVAVFNNTLSGKSEGLRKDEVLVVSGSKEYILVMGKYEASELDDLLGYKVNVTYSEDSSGDLTLESIKKASSNEEYTVNDIDIIEVTETSIEYYDESAKNGIRELKINTDMDVLKNRAPIDMDKLVDELKVENGQITFIDIDDNSVMDIAFIKSYDVYFVGSVTKSNGIYNVYDKFDSSRKLQLDEDESEISVKLASNSSDKLTDTALSAISANSVVLVAEAEDGSDEIDVIVSKKTASGSSSSSEVKRIESGVSITFGTKKVYLSNYYLDNLEENESTQGVSVGDTCTAYLDHLGRLVAISKTTATVNYGYVTLAGSKSSSMDDENYLVRMYDTTGKLYSELPVASKGFKINGKSADAEDLEAAIATAAEIANEGKAESKIKNAESAVLVKYEIKNNELKSVYLIDEETDEESDDYIEGAIHPKYIAEKTALTFRSSSNSFREGNTSKFTISSSTKVIVVPDDRSDAGYRFTTGTGYFTDGLTYLIDAYDADGTSPAKVVVVYGISNTIKATADTILVKSIEEELNSYNEKVEKLTYYKLGSGEEEFFAYGEEEDVFDGIESGDIIRFFVVGDYYEEIDGSDVKVGIIVNNVELMLDASEDEFIVPDNYTNEKYPGAIYHTVGGTYVAMYGTLIKKPNVMSGGADKDENIQVSATGSVDDEITFTVSSSTTSPTPIIRYVGDEPDDIFEFGLTEYDLVDINPDPDLASKVFIVRRGSSGNIQAIVIYE